ncbi:hypothetical protein LINPERHAP1_LOCUS4743 [Linum perenne]
MDRMVSDILLQALLIFASVFMFLYTHDVPQKLFAKLHHRARAVETEAKRCFVRGAQLLAEARSSSSNKSQSSLAKQAEEQADKSRFFRRGSVAAGHQVTHQNGEGRRSVP